VPARWEHALVLAVVLLMAGAAVRWAFFVDHYQHFDDLGLFNPPYMKAHYGKVTYPAHGEFRAITVHPPLHYWIIGTLMRLGFRPYYAEAIPPFFMILLSLVLIGAGRFPVPVKLGLLFAPSVLYFNYLQPSIFGPNMRPDTHRSLALFAGLVALESGRISGWNKALLFLGSLLLTFSSALHYPGAVASAGVAVYALWVLVETGWRRALGRLGALGAGAGTIGVPYLTAFLIPHHAQILQLIQAADPVAGPLASLGTHMRFYEVFWRLLRAVGPAKLLLVPVWFQIPLILLALITLLVPPSTRALAIAALPYPLFLLLFVQRKYWGPGYFLPEILLYIAGIGVAALTFLYVLTRALSTQARAAVVSISVLFITAVLITPGLRVPHGPLGPVHQAEIARAAARSILGPGALVASRQVMLFYASGGGRYYDVSADVLVDEPRDPAAYFAPFDSVVEPSVFSFDTRNRSHKSLTSWYADGTLKLRGFYLTAREPALPYLMLTAGTPATVEGYALSGSGELARYVQQEGGDRLLVAAVCRAGALPADSRMFAHTAFVLPPSQRGPNDLLPPVGALQQEVTVMLISRGDHALGSHVRRTCHVRDEVLLKKVSVNWHDLVATLRHDQPIRFYESWPDAVNRHSASGTPGGGASP
jgi:hypothetical protein